MSFALIFFIGILASLSVRGRSDPLPVRALALANPFLPMVLDGCSGGMAGRFAAKVFSCCARWFSRAWAWGNRRRAARRFALEFPALIESLQCCLRAGVSLSETLVFLANRKRWSPPLHGVLTGMARARANGVPLEDVFERLRRDKVRSKEGRSIRLLLLILAVTHAGGADADAALETLKAKFKESCDHERKLTIATAPVKAQARVISAAPVALGGILAVVDPGRVAFFWSDESGFLLFLAMVFLYALGIGLLHHLGGVRWDG